MRITRIKRDEQRIVKIIRNPEYLNVQVLILDDGTELCENASIVNKLLGEKLTSGLIWYPEKTEHPILDKEMLIELIKAEHDKDFKALIEWLKNPQHSYKKLPYYWKDIYSKLLKLGYQF